MAWSYHRQIKIIPGVHLNFSKNGISTCIGVKGADMTLDTQGTSVNTRVPGTSFSRQQQMLHGGTGLHHQFIPQPVECFGNIFSADPQIITSQDMQGIKEAILAARQQRTACKNDLVKIKTSLLRSRIQLAASYLFVLGFINKSFTETIRTAIATKQEAIRQLVIQIENCYVTLDIDFDPVIKVKYDRLVSSFKNLCHSNKIWDVTSAHYQDRKVTRSAASTMVDKKEVRFDVKGLEDIKSNLDVLYFKNANGADIYFYPGFIVMYSSRESFALIGYQELQLFHMPVRFVESGTVPGDTKVIDETWAKVNKNGSPDRRFKGNHKIPVVRYGQINLRTVTGLQEEYEFSNYEFSEQFASAFLDFQNMVQ